MEVEEYLLRLEKNLILGAGRWVADFRESFRKFSVGGCTFDLYIRGSVRPKGFLISRLLAYFTLPDYKVAFYACHLPEDGFSLSRLCSAVERHSAQKNIKWNWLALFRSKDFPKSVVKRVNSFKRENIGIALINTEEQDIETSPNFLGQKAVAMVRVFR